MTAIDFTPLSEILPLLIFLVVFILTFAVLNKTKVIENSFMQLLIAFLLSTIFITATGARDYVEVVTPWFAILLVCLFFIMAVHLFSPYLNHPLGIGLLLFIDAYLRTGGDQWEAAIDLTKIKTYDQLPNNAKKYLRRIEELLKVPISIVSVGPRREQTIVARNEFLI